MINIISLVRPDLVFIFVWSFSIFLAYNFSYFGLPTLEINSPIIIYILYLSIQYSAIFQFFKKFFNIPLLPPKNNLLEKYSFFKQRSLLKLSYLFISFWLFVFLLTWISFGSFPLLSVLFGNSEIIYANFALPTIAGFGNLFRIMGSSLLAIYLIKEYSNLKKFRLSFKFLLFIFVLFSPSILYLARGDQVFILLVVLSTIITFFHKNISFRKLWFYLILLVIFALVGGICFGLFNIIRYGNSQVEFYQNLDDLTFFIEGLNYKSKINQLSFLTEGQFGLISFPFFSYFSSPINNINLKLLESADFNFNFQFLNQVFPTFIRNFLIEKNDYGSLLIDFFNTSSFLDSYIKSFGLFGSLIPIFFIQVISVFCYLKAFMGSIYFRLIYPIIFTANFLSFFSDYFTILTFLLYPIVIIAFWRNIKNSII